MTISDASSSNFNGFRNPVEVKLIEKVHSDDKRAIEYLFEKYEGVILKISESYVKRGVSSEQRIDIGNRSLLIAAKRFQETNGIRFISYMYWWVRESIRQAFKA